MPSPKVVLIIVPKPADRRALIDEYCRLDQELGPKDKRKKDLKEQIASWHPKLARDPFYTVREEGDHFTLDIGIQSEQSAVTGIERLYRLLGIRQFIGFVERCRPTLIALKEFVPDEQTREKFVTTSRTGWRRFDVTKKFTDVA